MKQQSYSNSKSFPILYIAMIHKSNSENAHNRQVRNLATHRFWHKSFLFIFSFSVISENINSHILELCSIHFNKNLMKAIIVEFNTILVLYKISNLQNLVYIKAE